jgi:hypothetical protein
MDSTMTTKMSDNEFGYHGGVTMADCIKEDHCQNCHEACHGRGRLSYVYIKQFLCSECYGRVDRSPRRDVISLNIAQKMLNYWSKQVCCCNRERRVLAAMTEEQRDAIEQYEVAVKNIAFWKKELAVEQGHLDEMYATALLDEGHIEEQRRRFAPIGPADRQWEWDGYQKRRVAMCKDHIAKNERELMTACYRYAKFNP